MSPRRKKGGWVSLRTYVLAWGGQVVHMLSPGAGTQSVCLYLCVEAALTHIHIHMFLVNPSHGATAPSSHTGPHTPS